MATNEPIHLGGLSHIEARFVAGLLARPAHNWGLTLRRTDGTLCACFWREPEQCLCLIGCLNTLPRHASALAFMAKRLQRFSVAVIEEDSRLAGGGSYRYLIGLAVEQKCSSYMRKAYKAQMQNELWDLPLRLIKG